MAKNVNEKVFENAVARCEVVERIGATGNPYKCVVVQLTNGSEQVLFFKERSFGDLLDFLETK